MNALELTQHRVAFLNLYESNSVVCPSITCVSLIPRGSVATTILRTSCSYITPSNLYNGVVMVSMPAVLVTTDYSSLQIFHYESASTYCLNNDNLRVLPNSLFYVRGSSKDICGFINRTGTGTAYRSFSPKPTEPYFIARF